MAYRKTNFVPNREINKTGAANYEDVYTIIRDNVDQEFEFYEIEPAVVKEIFIEPGSLPIVDKLPDYSVYGSIRARYLESQNRDDIIEEYIKPLSSHMVVYPIIGEVVNVARYGDQLFYYTPINFHNKVNMNRVAGASRDTEGPKPGITKKNRQFASMKGDININGRFGHGVKFTSNEDYRYPVIQITNGQYNDIRKDKNLYFPHVQNINDDGSTMLFSSGELTDKNKIIIPAAKSSWWPTKWKTSILGNLIVLNSDSLVFNAKGRKGDLHLFATRTIGMGANHSITLEVGKAGVINLGESDSTNPILKGVQTKDLFEKIFFTLLNFSNALKSLPEQPEINSAAEAMYDSIVDIEKRVLPKVFSKTVYIIEEKRNDFVESVGQQPLARVTY
jgi:hypothetical protein|tara:strand:- start:1339 stop:2511 length:1173 start_codon:yes stop_codon:yes gene_type:complete